MSVRDFAKRSVCTQYLSVALAVLIAASGTIPASMAPRVVYADDITPPPAPPAQTPIIGFIDTHLHQFANLGFGGLEVWGSPVDPTLDASASLETSRARALPDSDYLYVADGEIGNIRGPFGVAPPSSHGAFAQCPTADPCYRVNIHGIDGGDDLLNSIITNKTHDTNGYRAAGSGDPGLQWPTWHTVTTQQAYWEWLKRAHQHGLKMITMHAVNNSVLCNLGVGKVPFGCDDDDAAARQIQGAKDLQTYIDAREGGAGQGFYRIVYTGAQAREVIAQGKMAVVLGVEIDTPQGCAKNVDCSERVASLVQSYYDMGVRVMYPVHLIDNAFGGTALFTSLFDFNNYLVNHQFWGVTNACSAPGDPMNVTWRSGIRDVFTPEFKVGLAIAVPAAIALIAGAIALAGNTVQFQLR